MSEEEGQLLDGTHELYEIPAATVDEDEEYDDEDEDDYENG